MSPEELVQAGRLREALGMVEERVRNQPAVARHRFFLFQLLSVLGDWNRALSQLNIAAELDADANLVAPIYRHALQCEALRAEVFRGNQTPLIFSEPEEWVALMIAANQKWARFQVNEAIALRRSAMRMVDVIPGTLNGTPFSFLMDADARLGPIVDAIIEGRYFWIPLTRVRRISLQPPESLHHLVWARAEFTWTNDGQSAGLIPVRYSTPQCLIKSNPTDQDDPLLMLARKTEWSNHGPGIFVGCGQRHWAMKDTVAACQEVQDINFERQSGDDSAKPAAADAAGARGG